MEKRLLWIALILSVIWVGVPSIGGLYSQCVGGTYAGIITPTLSWQTIPCIRGGEYYRFFATAGTPVTFSFCNGGGLATFDSEITIRTDADTYAGGHTNGSQCGLGDFLWFWNPPSTGWFRVLVNKAVCQTDPGCSILAYHTELDPLGAAGRTCATPWVVPSIPFVQTGLTTCNYGNEYTSNAGCPSVYMTGPDFVAKFDGTAGQCISIYTNNTFIYTGLFLFNGCPNLGGTSCVAFQEGSAGNPQLSNITLPTTGQYYLVVDTRSASVPCTGFDLSILPCVGIGQGATCASAFTIPSIPYSQVGFTTCGRGNTYNSTMACGSTFMNGEDFLFKYVSPGNECINISLAMTATNTGFFVYNGCPNVLGTTCIASRTATSGNPKLRNISLMAPGTYYFMVSTQPNPLCTSFDIAVDRCAPECTYNPNLNNNCGTPQAVSFGLLDTVCGHSDLNFTPDVTADLSSDFCGSIENNGWFSFVADSTKMTLKVKVTNCLSGFGIQGRVYQTLDCINYTPYSNCWNPMQQSDGIIQATGLTIGNTYVLMIDGYSADDCDFLVTRVFSNLPVEWTNFQAKPTGPETVQVDWSTGAEVNNLGFYVQRGYQRSKAGKDNFVWESIAFVEPQGSENSGSSYTYVDHPEYLGKPWYYRVQQVDLDGTADYTEYQEVQIKGADAPILHRLYPNPASRLVTIDYYTDQGGATSFAMYNLSGMLMKQENFSTGFRGRFTETVMIDDLANGLYFYVFSINGKLFHGKVEVLH